MDFNMSRYELSKASTYWYFLKRNDFNRRNENQRKLISDDELARIFSMNYDRLYGDNGPENNPEVISEWCRRNGHPEYDIILDSHDSINELFQRMLDRDVLAVYYDLYNQRYEPEPVSEIDEDRLVQEAERAAEMAFEARLMRTSPDTYDQ